MVKFFTNAFINPFLAMIFFLGFGGWWLFIGFQSVTVDLERSSDQGINGTVTRKHLLGLYTVTTPVTGVTEADRMACVDSSTMLRGVVIVAKSGPVSLFGAQSTGKRIDISGRSLKNFRKHVERQC